MRYFILGLVLLSSLRAVGAELDLEKVPKGPVGGGAKAKYSHAPFEAGDCAACHERKDPKNPGKVTQASVPLCHSCHDEVEAFLADRPVKHSPAKKNCGICHNSHDSLEPMLLLAPATPLCLSCHPDTAKALAGKTGKAATEGAKCLSCHEAHASKHARLLRKPGPGPCLGK